MKTELNKNEKLSTEQEAPPIANVLLAAVYSEQERIMIRNGWCVAYNSWWKHKDEGLDFRQMETKLIEALECSLLNGY